MHGERQSSPRGRRRKIQTPRVGGRDHGSDGRRRPEIGAAAARSPGESAAERFRSFRNSDRQMKLSFLLIGKKHLPQNAGILQSLAVNKLPGAAASDPAREKEGRVSDNAAVGEISLMLRGCNNTRCRTSQWPSTRLTSTATAPSHEGGGGIPLHHFLSP